MLFAPDFCIRFFLCLSIRLYWLIKKNKMKLLNMTFIFRLVYSYIHHL